MMTVKKIYHEADRLADQEAEKLKNYRKSISWAFILRFNLRLRKQYRFFIHELERIKGVADKIDFIRLKTAHYEAILEKVLDDLTKWELKYRCSIESRPEIERNISLLAEEVYKLEAYIHFYEFALTYYHHQNHRTA